MHGTKSGQRVSGVTRGAKVMSRSRCAEPIRWLFLAIIAWRTRWRPLRSATSRSCAACSMCSAIRSRKQKPTSLIATRRRLAGSLTGRFAGRRGQGSGGIDRLRRSVFGLNYVLHPTGVFQHRLRRTGRRGGIGFARLAALGSNQGSHPSNKNGRGGIDCLRQPVFGSNCVLHPTGMFQHRLRRTGGRGGIRTHGWFNPTLDFESSALNRTQPPFL